ncbi:MAG: hypothetical protein Q9168_005119 [Polycauliona sp. 1 TL-2023]
MSDNWDRKRCIEAADFLLTMAQSKRAIDDRANDSNDLEAEIGLREGRHHFLLERVTKRDGASPTAATSNESAETADGPSRDTTAQSSPGSRPASPSSSESSDSDAESSEESSAAASSDSLPLLSRSSSPAGSTYSDTLTSMEYPIVLMGSESRPGSPAVSAHSVSRLSMDDPIVLTPGTDDTDDSPGSTTSTGTNIPPDTTSHVITIDSPIRNGHFTPAVPHPDASLDEVREYLRAHIVWTLHYPEGQTLEDAEAQAATYVARFVAAFVAAFDQAPTELNAGHLYSCSEERLRQILSDGDADPPKTLRHVCSNLDRALVSSKYGMNSNKWSTVLLTISIMCIVCSFIFNVAAVFSKLPMMLAVSVMVATLIQLIFRGQYKVRSSKEMLANKDISECWKPRPWCLDPDFFDWFFWISMATIWAMPMLVLAFKIFTGIAFLLSVVFGFLMS